MRAIRRIIKQTPIKSSLCDQSVLLTGGVTLLVGGIALLSLHNEHEKRIFDLTEKYWDVKNDKHKVET